MGWMQRGLGLRHGVRPEVPGRPGIGRRRFSESDELAQQQGRKKGTYNNNSDNNNITIT